MLLGSVADDFTGASDLANTLARGGMRTTLFVGVPEAVLPECEAGVIALKSRSIPAPEAVEQSLAALGALRAAGAKQILFKYCSTFDSTREGNIGPVADAMIEALSAPVAIVCPAFPTNLRTIYRGHLFVGDRLLNESGMEKHPLTPMTDANLQRWLSYQSQNRIGLITLDTIRKGPDAIRAALDEAARRKERLVVCDAITDDDLLRLGEAAKGMALVTGGSGIALGLPANFGRSPSAAALPPRAPSGRAIALSGSCSRATLAQVARHRAEAPALTLDAAAIVESRFTPAEVMGWLGGEAGKAPLPLVYSSAAPEEVSALQARFGTEKVAHAVEGFFAGLARTLVASGYTRLITAGGETSSAIVGGLALKALAIGPEIDPGVPALVHEGEPALALALKSGNFGAPDFFAKALAVMDGMAGGQA
ncbi:MAG: four-carbon acid sugar kinase family protein [Beijerinckiaceae bacterium]|nr:four-carbon acid sugar kinase family protein [Beijerinckiaceae bacterium]